MENLVFESEADLDKFLEGKIKLGHGFEGDCYLLEGKWVLKRFKTPHNIDFSEDYLQFRNVKIDNVSFVKYVVHAEGYLAGVITPYIKGVDIYKFPLAREEISKVASATQNMTLTIQKLNNAGIWTWDVHNKNIIYHNKKLGIIDTIMFEWLKDDLSKERWNWFIMRTIILSAFGNNVPKYLEMMKSTFRNYSKDIEMLKNPRELLLGVKAQLEEFLQIPVERFSDAEEPLRRILEK